MTRSARTLGEIDGAAAAEARRGPVLTIILAGYLLILIDVSILMAALPRIHAELHFSATGLSWASAMLIRTSLELQQTPRSRRHEGTGAPQENQQES